MFYLPFEQLERLKEIIEGLLDSVSNLWKRTDIFFRIHNICLFCKSLFHFCCLHAKLIAQQYASMWLYNTGDICIMTFFNPVIRANNKATVLQPSLADGE